ncbi:MAG: hypothetical protein ABL932_25930, partial [Terricaulis sp.]
MARIAPLRGEARERRNKSRADRRGNFKPPGEVGDAGDILGNESQRNAANGHGRAVAKKAVKPVGATGEEFAPCWPKIMGARRRQHEEPVEEEALFFRIEPLALHAPPRKRLKSHAERTGMRHERAQRRFRQAIGVGDILEQSFKVFGHRRERSRRGAVCLSYLASQNRLVSGRDRCSASETRPPSQA